jgi:hypothetical protein
MATLAFLAMQSSAIATPLTLLFDAEVRHISPGIPFDSGLNVQVGDTVSGMLQFHPKATGGSFLEVVEPFLAQIFVDGKTLTTPTSIADLTLRSRDNVGIVDYPPALVIDTIVVGSTLGPANPEALPNVAPDQSSFRINLWGDPSILETPSLPADATVWNTFQFERSIGITVRDGLGGVVGFTATVGNIILVPEPSALQLAVGSIMAAVSQIFGPRPRARSYRSSR